MPSRPAVEFRRQTPVAGLDSEAGRAFYQERLAFWLKIGLIISATFFLVGTLLSPLYRPLYRAADVASWPGPALHLLTLLVMGAVLLVCRRRRLSVRALDLLDAIVVLVTLAGFAAGLFFSPPVVLEKMRYTVVLTAMCLLVGRAAFVPSTSHRTLWLSLGGSALVLGAIVATASGELPGTPFGEVQAADTVWTGLWLLSAVGIASVTSAAIYGLRQEVRQARQLGQYTLRERLGAGGMGVVYKASHAMLRRPTAVKLLPPLRAGETAVARFEREVQLTASLTHPNTVAVYDYGRTPDGVFYYAMEYLEGIDLAALVEEDGPQPPARVRHVLLQVVGALGEAHGVGLIHRDVKAANVILCQRGGVYDVAKVVDFGLVKDLDAAESVALTQAQTIAGTPQYLAPEVLTSPGRVDARVDLYALGCVGYLLLAGTPVFEGRTSVEVCSHHLHTPPEPPSRRLGRSLPPDLEAVILRCLEKDPAGRPRDAGELGRALEACRGVGGWEQAAAAAWWEGRGRQIRERRAHRAIEEGDGPPTLSVDLQGRLSSAHPAWPWR